MPHKDPEVARAWRRKWWARSPEIRDKQNARTRAMRERINEMLRAHKVAVGCADCGYKGHHAALEFHHLGDDKDINLSFAKSLAQAEREMEKCEVLCSNCHRIRHWNEAHPCKPDIFAATYEPVSDDAPVAPQAEPCIGNDSACPCQDGDACHYKDAADGTKAWSVPQAEPKREPLSDDAISYEHACRSSYESACAASDFDSFKLGVRFAERAHRIGGTDPALDDLQAKERA